MIKKISLILMLAFSQIYGRISGEVYDDLGFLQLCLRYVQSNGLNEENLIWSIQSIKNELANYGKINWNTGRTNFHINHNKLHVNFQWSDSPQLILPGKYFTINCSTCHNWDLKMLESMVSFNHYCIYVESQTGQTLLSEYTLLNKIEHVEYLLSLNKNQAMFDKFDKQVKAACQIAWKSGNGELIQLFQNYFKKIELNLQIAELQNTLHNLQTIDLTYQLKAFKICA